MEGLFIVGIACIGYSVYITFKYMNMKFENIDLAEFHKTMNRGSIVAGIGSLAFIVEGIQSHSYLSIICNTLALVINVYFFRERNMKQK
ncbi:MAG: hypothetical protein SFY32_09440 [Bacteroidota bacterium]|nr:hypothetical protein [Bacteroidota bacterium]